MHRIDTDGTVLSAPTPPPVGSTVGYFSDGDAITGTSGTVISAAWLNAVQDEIANVIFEAGISLDKTETDQLKQAILQIIANNAISGAVGTTDGTVVRVNSDGTVSSSSSVKADPLAEPSAALDISSFDKGLLIPRLSTVERDGIESPATGLLIFNADEKRFQVCADSLWKNITPTHPLTFEVIGPYSSGGPVQNAVMIERCGQTRRILGASLFVNQNGESGSLQVDVKVSTDAGVNWVSIFSAKPKVLASAGDLASSSAAVLVDPTVVYSSTALFRLDIESVPAGLPNDFVLSLESEVL